jgi:transposase InsO family protein
LKTELIHHRQFATRHEARAEIFEYIEGFYNCRRRHSSLRYQSPMEFERQTAENAPGSRAAALAIWHGRDDDC